ncbi:MAG: DNA polymerase IV [Candidatus Paceibacterota bacterium]
MYVLHIDGDSFFASVEQARDPALKGKPVVTGKERGVVTAVSVEAKKRGVTRGMPAWEIRKLCPEIRFVRSDYRLYSMISRRMFAIARRHCDVVDEYSIDEFFAGVSGDVAEVEGVAWRVKTEIQRELGITVSVGLASTKVLAKVASNWSKPDGFTSLLGAEVTSYLRQLNCENVWGIGSSTAMTLARLGVRTAEQFASRSHEWVREHLSKPYEEIWYELQGKTAMPLAEQQHTRRSLRSSRTFAPTCSRETVMRELARNIERACCKLRREGLRARRATVFLKTQQFEYASSDVPLPVATARAHRVLDLVEDAVYELFRPGTEYRTTGIVLADLVSHTQVQPDLFGRQQQSDGSEKLYDVIDQLNQRFGDGHVALAASLGSRLGLPAPRVQPDLVGRLRLPHFGEVS